MHILASMGRGLALLGPKNLERLGAALGFLAFSLGKKRRAIAIANVRRAFPDWDQKALHKTALSAYKHFCWTILECWAAPTISLTEHIDFKGEEHLREALARGKGAYVLCFHSGNWEAMAAKVSLSICPAHIYVKKVGSPWLNSFVLARRKEVGFLAVERKGGAEGALALRRVLKKGEILGFVFDQSRPSEPRIPFFGHPCKTNTSLAALWRRFEAPIVPGWIERHGFGQHTIHFSPALKLEKTTDTEADLFRLSAEYNAAIEKLIRLKPDQYFWLHNRWK